MDVIGYLGLGVMGTGMSGNLIDKYNGKVYGYDPVAEVLDRFEQRGGTRATSAEDLYKNCNVIMMCLPTNQIVKETIKHILEISRPGTIIVDMGATAPHIICELHEMASEKGLFLLDAPVSGGTAGAEAGTLAIMCGGEKTVFDRVLPYLKMMGKTVTYVGPSGCGDVAKLANNIIVNVGLMTAGEAFAFAKKAGVDSRVLFEAMRGGVAETAILNLRAPIIFSREFLPATARATIAMKDAVNAVDMAKSMGVEIPLTEMLLDRYRWMVEQGIGNEDHSAIVKYYEDSMGVVIE